MTVEMPEGWSDFFVATAGQRVRWPD